MQLHGSVSPWRLVSPQGILVEETASVRHAMGHLQLCSSQGSVDVRAGHNHVPRRNPVLLITGTKPGSL